MAVGVVIGFEPPMWDSARRSLVPRHQFLDASDYPEAVTLLEKESFWFQLTLARLYAKYFRWHVVYKGFLF